MMPGQKQRLISKIMSRKISVLYIESELKIKEDHFVGSKICELILDDEFKRNPRPRESAPWEELLQVVQILLRNHRAENYAESK